MGRSSARHERYVLLINHLYGVTMGCVVKDTAHMLNRKWVSREKKREADRAGLVRSHTQPCHRSSGAANDMPLFHDGFA